MRFLEIAIEFTSILEFFHFSACNKEKRLLRPLNNWNLSFFICIYQLCWVSFDYPLFLKFSSVFLFYFVVAIIAITDGFICLFFKTFFFWVFNFVNSYCLVFGDLSCYFIHHCSGNCLKGFIWLVTEIFFFKKWKTRNEKQEKKKKTERGHILCF